jgi:hypothetical protein
MLYMVHQGDALPKVMEGDTLPYGYGMVSIRAIRARAIAEFTYYELSLQLHYVLQCTHRRLAYGHLQCGHCP